MKIRSWLAVLLLPLFGTTAFAFLLVDPVGPLQRAQMIANQIIMIANQTLQLATMGSQLTELQDQYQHLKDAAEGRVNAIRDPFTDLASQSTALVSSALTWKDDFTGIPGEIAASVQAMGEDGKSFAESWRPRLAAADTVTESDILSLYGGFRPEVGTRAAAGYRAAREEGDKSLVSAHAMSDAAAELMAAVKAAMASYEKLRENTNVSNTALQQSQVTGAVTQGNLTVAMSQLMAFQAAKESAEDYEREIARREELARRVEITRQTNADFTAHQAGLDARRDSLREGLLFKIPTTYGGSTP